MLSVWLCCSLQYVYMNDQGKEVASKDQATVIIDGEWIYQWYW